MIEMRTSQYDSIRCGRVPSDWPLFGGLTWPHGLRGWVVRLPFVRWGIVAIRRGGFDVFHGEDPSGRCFCDGEPWPCRAMESSRP